MQEVIAVDKGTEFIETFFDNSEYIYVLILEFGRLDNLVGNAFIENLNLILRKECLDDVLFLSCNHTRQIIEEGQMITLITSRIVYRES